MPGVDPQGKLLLPDVTTTNVGCKTAIEAYKSATDRGGAARGAEQRKATDYEKCLDPNSQSLMPLAFELQFRWISISLRFYEYDADELVCKSVTYRDKGIPPGMPSGDGPYRLDF